LTDFIFGKIGRIASEKNHTGNNMLFSFLLYGAEVFTLNKSELLSLDFVIKPFVLETL